MYSILDQFTVSFFGHRETDNTVLAQHNLEIFITTLLQEKEYVVFLVGRDGEFDLLVASTVRRLKRTVRDDNSALSWVLPYLTAEYRENEDAYLAYYDEVEICEYAASGHFRAALHTRNQQMVKRSNLIACYIDHHSGGAYQTVQYALKHGKPVLNLAAQTPWRLSLYH